jgi:enamine deaminase RidA (YjgF/YER057c/UK114 family)
MSERRRVSSGSPFEATVGYCRAVAVGDRIFVAGTAPIWPDGTVAPAPGDQARRCFEIIEAALGELGSGLADIVRTRVYLVDAADFADIGAVHGELLGDVRPANTTVVVAALLDPRWRVEIEVEAVSSAG